MANGTSRTLVTASTNSSLMEIGQKHVTKGLGRIAEGIMSTGKGSYVTFDNGKQMLDFTCGIGVTGLGQCVSCFTIVVADLLSDYDVVHRVQDIAIRKLAKLLQNNVWNSCTHNAVSHSMDRTFDSSKSSSQ